MLKIVQLVKIKLSNDEIEHYSKELTMLDWIHDILLRVNTKDVSPIRYGSIDKDIHVRDDVVNFQSMKEEILSNTKSDHAYFVVPKYVPPLTYNIAPSRSPYSLLHVLCYHSHDY